MASNPGTPFALRPLPFPQSDRKPTTLADFIARVNADKGGFRNVTEESLRKELEAEMNDDVVDSKEVDMLDGDSGVNGDAEQISVEDFHEAINEVRRNAEYVSFFRALEDGQGHTDVAVGSRTRTPCLLSTSSPC